MAEKYRIKKLARRHAGVALLLIVWGGWLAQPSYSTNQWASLPSVSLPPNQRVLVIYHANVPDSLKVAEYYMARRKIPASYKCAIAPPSTSSVNWADFEAMVKTPIRDCLDSVGRDEILYLVFTYQTPYRLEQVPVGPDFELRSLDQYVADIWDEFAPAEGGPLAEHPYFAAAQSQGNVYPPFRSLADYRDRPSGLHLYSVWRLDAATAELAQGLVDKAIQAEKDGLSGQGCFDRNLGPVAGLADWSYAAADWDLHQAAEFARQAGFPVTEDEQEAEFGTLPAPLRCDAAALYAGWYAYNHYNDAFTWQPGAIGFHLDSASALDPRGGDNWAANAIIKGITVTSGSVGEPYLEGLPHADGVFRNLFEGANVGDAFLRNTAFLKWMVINLGDPLYCPFREGVPPFSSGSPTPASLSLDPPFVVGGQPSVGMVTLAAPAPAGGAAVTLTGLSAEVATTPTTLIIPEGVSAGSFTVSTQAVSVYQPMILTAAYAGQRVSNTLVAGPLLGGLTIRPRYVMGGTSATGTIALNGAAPAGGVTITLTSDNRAVADVPANWVVPEGVSTVDFTVTTSAVAADTAVTFSATYGGAVETATLIVIPAKAQ